MPFWWVNQKQSYRQERAAGILWAPLLTRNNRSQPHWESMADTLAGDVVLHYAGGVVRALSQVTVPAVDARRPVDLPDDLWDANGRLVRTRYLDAVDPVRLDEIALDRRLRHSTGGPFRQDGAVKVGYLFPLDDDFATSFLGDFGSRFPALQPLLPPEANDTAEDLLRRLLGADLSTIRGERNVILAVNPPYVTVATQRSPNGQPVPIEWVQDALDRLRADGQLTINPVEVGYRSAFIGAVLLTLPGARAGGSPPVITVNPAAPDTSTALPFEGDLSRSQETEVRGEQPALRRRLFGTASYAQCAICGETYPVRFLHAAHIKKRSRCSEEERRDLDHIAMPACTLGCDALYELGFISIDDSGLIITAPALDAGDALRKRLEELRGRNCLSATTASAVYYRWHRENVLRSE